MDDHETKDKILGPEEATHELVELCHVRPRLKPGSSSVCVPHYFSGATPWSRHRWNSLVGNVEPLPEIDVLEWLEIMPSNVSAIFDSPYINDDFAERHHTAFMRARDLRTALPSKLMIEQAQSAQRVVELTTGVLDWKLRWRSSRTWIAFFDAKTVSSWPDWRRRRGDERPVKERIFGDKQPRWERDGLWLEVSRQAQGGESKPSLLLFNDEDFVVPALLSGAALRNRYSWQLIFGYDHCASAAVPVERNALPELVRLRDIPAGKKRRAALAHFVAAHYRRGRSQAPTEDPAIWVRKHLRGERLFRWDGLTCEVRPPAYEVEAMQSQRTQSL